MSLPAFINRQLAQTIVYWAPTGSDGYGGYTYANPVELRARVEQVTEVIQSTMDEELISRAAAYVTQRLERGGYVYLGSLEDSEIEGLASDADPESLESTMVILANEVIPRLGSSTINMYKVYLNVSKELRPPYVK